MTVFAQAWRPFGPDEPIVWLNLGLLALAAVGVYLWKTRQGRK